MRTPPVVRRYLPLLAVAGTLAASACAQQSALPTAGAPVAGSTARTGAAVPRRARGKTLPANLLFVTNENGTISIYALSNPGQGPLATISGLTGYQQQMVVDKSGNLFVVNNGPSAGDDYVSVFAPPYNGPPKILSTVWQSQIFYPVGVAVDSHGTAYVSNCGAYCLETAAIFAYPSGATSPASAITSTKFNSLGGLAIDAHDNLYATEWNTQTLGVDVFKVAAGSTTPKPLRLHGLTTGNGANGVTLDASGNLFVGVNANSDYVLAFHPGAHNAYKIIDKWPFAYSPTMIDVGPDGNLYVPFYCPFAPSMQVDAYKPHSGKPFESIGPSQYPGSTLGVATAPNLQLENK
jgi:hypothetical protein